MSYDRAYPRPCHHLPGAGDHQELADHSWPPSRLHIIQTHSMLASTYIWDFFWLFSKYFCHIIPTHPRLFLKNFSTLSKHTQCCPQHIYGIFFAFLANILVILSLVVKSLGCVVKSLGCVVIHDTPKAFLEKFQYIIQPHSMLSLTYIWDIFWLFSKYFCHIITTHPRLFLKNVSTLSKRTQCWP